MIFAMVFAMAWWRDIDFGKGLLSINKASLYLLEKGVFEDTTKTKRSNRVIKLPHGKGITVQTNSCSFRLCFYVTTNTIYSHAIKSSNAQASNVLKNMLFSKKAWINKYTRSEWCFKFVLSLILQIKHPYRHNKSALREDKDEWEEAVTIKFHQTHIKCVDSPLYIVEKRRINSNYNVESLYISAKLRYDI